MLLSLLILFLLFSSIIDSIKPKDAVLLSQVRTLTLQANAKTSNRRVPAIPQLTCRGPGCVFYKVDLMRCKNQGPAYDPEDIEWSCSANLPREFKLGNTDVICEGYSSPNDKYVLKGSCGVNYRLLLTEYGEEKFGHYKGPREEEWRFPSLLYTIIFLGVLFWILYSAFRALPFGNPFRRIGRFWGDGGGGGGDFPWGPPPPYFTKRRNDAQQQDRWRPGFWSGALGGAAAGFLAGNRDSSSRFSFLERNDRFFNEADSHNGRSNRSMNGSSSARYESTGFGSTSRR